MSSPKIYKYFLIGIGWFFVALGIIGIFLPLMPTTIFFILGAACFARSSKKFYDWLINHPRFGPFIKDYREKGGMQLKTKVLAISMMILAIGSSAYFFTSKLWIRLMLLIIALGVSLYILSLKTISAEANPVEDSD